MSLQQVRTADRRTWCGYIIAALGVDGVLMARFVYRLVGLVARGANGEEDQSALQIEFPCRRLECFGNLLQRVGGHRIQKSCVFIAKDGGKEDVQCAENKIASPSTDPRHESADETQQQGNLCNDIELRCHRFDVIIFKRSVIKSD